MGYSVGSYPDRWYEARIGKQDEFPFDKQEIIQKDIVMDFETGAVRVVAERRVHCAGYVSTGENSVSTVHSADGAIITT